MTKRIARVLDEMESNGESAGALLAEHLRTVAENGPEYASTEALREEAGNVLAWAVQFLAQTGGVPPGLPVLSARS